MNENIKNELSKYKTSAEKFQYLSVLADLSWEDCQDAWFASRQLIPEIAKELTELANLRERNASLESRLRVAVEALEFYSNTENISDENFSHGRMVKEPNTVDGPGERYWEHDLGQIADKALAKISHGALTKIKGEGDRE